MKDRVEDIALEPLGVGDLHLRSQEHPPVSGRVPDKFPDLCFLVVLAVVITCIFVKFLHR